ncbi:MAG: hypothetical protein WCP34_04645 [Pseudomonadota bacterium]
MKVTLLLFFTLGVASVWAETLYPFVLGNKSATEVESALEKQGFEIAGKYAPFSGAQIWAVTSPELKQAASKSDFGVFGVAIRVAVTDVGGKAQVSYVNPPYMAAAYQMKDNLTDVASKLEAALGKEKTFGAEKPLSTEELAKYHYMGSMPYFKDRDELNEFSSQDQALAQVERALAAKTSGVSKVYRIDLPGRQESVFGVSLTQKAGADQPLMSKIDKGSLRQTAHLPYELVVVKGKVYALNGKFRIALSFPSLTMATFMRIASAPDDIRSALGDVAGRAFKVRANVVNPLD